MILQAFYQTMILFILIMCGVAAHRTGILNDERTKGLSEILVNVVGPAIVINGFMIDYDPAVRTNLIMAGLFSFLTYVLTILTSRYLFPPAKDYDSSVLRFTTIYANCAYMGIPLMSGMFGPECVYLIAPQIAIFSIFSYTQGVWMLSTRGQEEKFSPMMLLKNPPIIGIIIGLLIFSLRIPVPGLIREPIAMISGIQTPIAMFIAGVSISKTDFLHIRHLPALIKCSFMRLIAYPFIMALIIRFIPAEPLVKLVGITCAACPGAALGIVFAVKYNKDDILAAEIFSITTLCSALTIPVVMAWAQFLGITL